MTRDHAHSISAAGPPASQRFLDRCQRYCRRLVIAASVAFQQIGTDPTSPLRENPPYVQLLDEPRERFSRREVVGIWVLTTELGVPAVRDRVTGNQN